MFNLTVIFTRHDERGNCNSGELLKIVEAIKPEMIFEELLPSVYDQIYNQHIRTTLESEVVKLYSMTNLIEHLPVDTFESPDSYYTGVNHLLRVIGEYLNKSLSLNKAFNQLIRRSSEDGFKFLNSDENDVMIEEITEQENQILAEIGKDWLNEIAKLRLEVNSNREDAIIDNIYNYGEEKPFNTAILFIGSGHRKSMKAKIANQENREGLEIKWHFLVT